VWLIWDVYPELEFLKKKSLWGLGTEEVEGYRTGPPGYIGWRNSFLGIDSGAPYTFKNTGSGSEFFPSRIPDPNLFHPGSASKNVSILTRKKWFLSTQKYDPGFHLGSGS
jgi:hypothetical protein